MWRVNSGRWWWTGRPGVLRFMGSQRVGHDWATELNWTELNWMWLNPWIFLLWQEVFMPHGMFYPSSIRVATVIAVIYWGLTLNQALKYITLFDLHNSKGLILISFFWWWPKSGFETSRIWQKFPWKMAKLGFEFLALSFHHISYHTNLSSPKYFCCYMLLLGPKTFPIASKNPCSKPYYGKLSRCCISHRTGKMTETQTFLRIKSILLTTKT